ncbi:MAG TPA: sigma-70 family RNA polymerase sigma factor [Polyangiaceae bacterium]|nr:sigma-70 family RNA polymerase sigma factor [Polyangiaceae bacterium]
MTARATTSVESLVRDHLDLPPRLARQLVRELGLPQALANDLESAGREGLVGAANRFEPERGVPFRRYANHRVRGAMIDSLRREGRLPRRAYDRLQMLSAAVSLNEQLSEELASPPPPAASALADADARLAEHLANVATAMALGLLARPVRTEEETGDTLTALDSSPQPDEQLVRDETREQVIEALGDLPDQERALVRRHYFEGERFDHVAAELGLSKSWASRLHTRAVGRLTKRLTGTKKK